MFSFNYLARKRNAFDECWKPLTFNAFNVVVLELPRISENSHH